MSWLRIDDGFAMHPKVIQLSRADRWTWMDVLCYCARYRTDGVIPIGIESAVPKCNDQFILRCHHVGLLDNEGVDSVIHDWRDFNPKDPTAAERKQRERSRQGHEDVTDETVTETVTDRDSRVGTRARSRPVPSKTPPKEEPSLPSNESRPTNGTAHGKEGFEIGNILKEVGNA